MSRVLWRWVEQDFGFRFRSGKGKRMAEFYQAKRSGEFYVVPASQRKLSKVKLDELADLANEPTSPQVVANPWRNYQFKDWNRIDSEDGICLNYAGCLDQEEINRREDKGVQRAMELVAEFIARPEPVTLTRQLICQLHEELMGAVYPFAGKWRTVALHKGEGPTKWPFPPGGIQPLMDVFERDVLSRSPVLSDNDEEVFAYTSEVMNELLAIHPFREGNGRTVFILGNLLLMQNDMLPLNVYDRRTDEARYFAACEAGRIKKDYMPLAALLADWEDQALARWEENHGQ